jgi:hypothetical protein
LQLGADGALVLGDAIRDAAAATRPVQMGALAASFNRYQTRISAPEQLREALRGGVRGGQVREDLPSMQVVFNNTTMQLKPSCGIFDQRGTLRALFAAGGPDGSLIAYAWGTDGEAMLREAMMTYLGWRIEQRLQLKGYSRAPSPAAAAAGEVPTGTDSSVAAFELRTGGELRRQVSLATRSASPGHIDLHLVSNHTPNMAGSEPMADLLAALGLTGGMPQVVSHRPSPLPDTPGGLVGGARHYESQQASSGGHSSGRQS